MEQPAESAISWAGTPDPEQRTMYPIYTPKVGRDVMVVILGACLHGVFTHFYENQSRPCISPADACEGCIAGRNRRWKGFLAVWDRAKGRLALAEITQEAYLRCPAFESYKGALRGKTLRLVRAGTANNARVTATIAMYAGPPGSLPPAFNVQSALERIWFTKPGIRPVAQEAVPPIGEATRKIGHPELFEGDGPYGR